MWKRLNRSHLIELNNYIKKKMPESFLQIKFGFETLHAANFMFECVSSRCCNIHISCSSLKLFNSLGKQSRQVQLCTKVPPSSNKKNFYGGWGPGSSIGNSKSSLMKKSKVDFLKSQEVKNLTAMKRNAVQRNNSPLSIREPSGFSVKGGASTSQDIKPLQRRY